MIAGVYEVPSDPDDSPRADDIDQIVERLGWTPRERLQYLLDMLAFEERARLARPLPRRP